ncbi:MAG: hypothetical protein AAGE84_05170 [Cyanobacteria bacterium P01_G01_bin.39]
MKLSTNTQVVQEFFTAQYAGEFDRAFKDYVNPNFKLSPVSLAG